MPCPTASRSAKSGCVSSRSNLNIYLDSAHLLYRIDTGESQNRPLGALFTIGMSLASYLKIVLKSAYQLHDAGLLLASKTPL